MNGDGLRHGQGRPCFHGRMLAVLAACALAAPSTLAKRPTLQTVTVNGDMTDWDIVLADPLNVTVDGDGSTNDCGQSVDMDCLVTDGTLDLSRFAWTYDATRLYFFFERFATSPRTRSLWVYLDLDADGRMKFTDYLVRFDFSGAARTADYSLFRYSPNAGGGDDMCDGNGFADGFTVAGRAGGLLASAPPTTAGNVGGTQVETSVPWADLGVASGTPLQFHVAITDSGALPNTAADNAGGPNREVGTLGWIDVATSPGTVKTAAPGATVDFPHVVQLSGTYGDRLAFVVEPSQFVPFELWADTSVPADGVPDTLMALDTDGDGTFDTIQPGFDVEGDGVPDSGPFPTGGSFGVVLRVLLPGAPATVDSTLRLTAFTLADPATASTASDRVVSGALTLIPEHDDRAAVAVNVVFDHVLANHSGGSLDVRLDTASTRTLPYVIRVNGNPVTPNDGNADATLANGATATVTASLTVPALPVETVDVLTLTASGPGGAPSAVATDRLTVGDLVELTPDHLVSSGTNGFVGPGRTALHAHVLRNNSAAVESFTLFSASSLGWSRRLFLDTNFDGNPDQDITATQRVLAVPAYGGRAGILVQVQAPAAANLGDVDRTQLSAFGDAGGSATATDETVVRQLATYADAALRYPAVEFAACDTVYAAAYSLNRSVVDGYAFDWHDDLGIRQRHAVVSSDPAGQAHDEFVLPDGAHGTWQVKLMRDAGGGTFTVVETRDLDTALEALADQLATDQASYARTGDDLTVTFTLRNPNAVASLTPLSVAVTVLNPGRNQYLNAATAQFEAWSSEATRTYTTPTLAAGESFARSFTVPQVSYPSSGTFVVVLEWDSPCTSLSGSQETTFVVNAGASDRDGDTVPDATDNCPDAPNANQRDSNGNGVGDACECTGATLPEVTDLRVTKLGANVVLSWADMSATEPCITYETLKASGFPVDSFARFTVDASGLTMTTTPDVGAVNDGLFHAYLVRASSPAQGDGPLGHYGI